MMLPYHPTGGIAPRRPRHAALRAGCIALDLALVLVLPVGTAGVTLGLPVRAAAAGGQSYEETLAGLKDLMKTDQFAEAERSAREFLGHVEADSGSQSLAAARVIDVLATALCRGGKAGDPEAADLARRALAINEALQGPECLDVAASLRVLGEILYAKADFQGAVAAYERALATRERLLGPDHRDVGASLSDLAMPLFVLGEFQRALPLCERTLALREKLYGPEHQETAACAYNLATLLQAMGDYERARVLFERSLLVWTKILGPEHPTVAWNLNGLGILLCLMGDYTGARPLYERALAIREKALGANHPLVATTVNNLAMMHSETGNYEEARRLLERALSTWTETLPAGHHELAFCLTNLACVLRDSGDSEGARPRFEQALRIMETALGPDHPEVASCLLNLGSVCQALGDTQDALTHYQEAQSMLGNSLGTWHPVFAKGLCNQGALLRDLEKYPEGAALLERSLSIRTKALGSEHPETCASLQELALLRLFTGELSAAESLLTRAAETFEAARGRVGEGASRASFLRSPYAPLAGVCLMRGETERAWPAAEQALGRVIADALLTSRSHLLTPEEFAREDSIRDELARLEDELVTLQTAAVSDTSQVSSSRLPQARLAMLAAEARWNALQKRLRAKYPISEGGAFPLSRVQAALRPDEAVLGWLVERTGREEGGLWGYVIRHQGSVQWVHLGSSPLRCATRERCNLTISEPAARFLDKLMTAAAWPTRVELTAEVAASSRDLWRQWIAPMTPNLEGVRRLIILPSGPMLGMPVEAMVDSDGTYLGDRYTIGYAPSATVFALLRERAQERVPTGSRRALLMGDPVFRTEAAAALERNQATPSLPESRPLAGIDRRDSEAGSEKHLRSALLGDEEALAALPALPGTREEVRCVANVLPEATVLLGTDASEQRLWELENGGELRRFAIIHVATHGLIDDERPDRSALILSRDRLPDPLERVLNHERVCDGLVTAGEIAREWTLDAELVTLSACQSALGRAVAGEGYVGLASALLQAGARCLLVSLWKVDDQATALLMKRFYENLTGAYRDMRSGQTGRPIPKAEALQEAKQWLRSCMDEHGQHPFSHPAYWAGFILVGTESAM